jgi:hypothetical protein
MNDTHDDRNLQRLFADYDPAMAAEPFVDQTLVGLDREIRRARVRTATRYAIAIVLITVVAAATATPLNAVSSALDNTLRALAMGLSAVKAQALIYAATLGLLALARRRIRGFLEPW